jgi:hypothetical protein
VVLLVAALAFWAGTHAADSQRGTPAQQAATVAGLPNAIRSIRPRAAASGRHDAALAPGKVFVHRGGSVLRDAPKFSGQTLKKEAKGAAILLIADQGDGWAKVADGNITGWMRSSILGSDPPD